ncbi:DUF6089 family protein [Mucilaginibacter sp. PPCGB 2223]|uniref:type IX secretion system protein PorG n=1 Tax=Mucilaginibacter sp. PPCGB 2223 TaxID=1886027 RepID=UPI0009F6B95C|nr:DUF6089 family protein [Mucilaginibacter sp. PPCGB 2223]
MRKVKPVLVLLLMLISFAGRLSAQTWEVGGTVGESGYMGDFNQNNPFKLTDVSGGFFLKRNFSNYLSLKLQYMYGTIRGDDSTSANQQLFNRNLSFSSSLSEISLIGEFNFMSYIPEIGTNKYTPFIFAGIATVGFNPRASYKGTEYDLAPLTTEGQARPYNTRAWSVPYGAGLKFNFTGKWNFIVDLGYRYTNTGYLDDVYGAYPNKAVLPSALSRALSDRSAERTGESIGSAGSQRGNYAHDSYMFLGFTISYTFVTQNCYKF